MVPEIAVVQVGRDTFVYRVKAEDGVERVDVVTGALARRRGRDQAGGWKRASASWLMAPASCARA